MRTTWEYGGGAYPFALCDEACMGRLRDGLGQLKAADWDGTESQAEAYCRMLRAFFDTVLGEDAGAAVCGFDEDGCAEAYLSFTEYVSAQLEAIKALREAAEEKYLGRAEKFYGAGD